MIDKFIFFFSPPWVLHSEEKSNLRHVLDKKKNCFKSQAVRAYEAYPAYSACGKASATRMDAGNHGEALISNSARLALRNILYGSKYYNLASFSYQ